MIKNLELFKVFYYVASTRSLTKAAAELSITQPAVSQSMKQLEASLNVKLFNRTAKGIRLTDDGEVLFSYVSKGYETIEQGIKKLHDIMDLNEGEIIIGANDYGIKYYLLSHLETFKTKYPGIRLNITPMSDSEIIDSVSRGKIDIGITLDNGSKNTDSVSVRDIDTINYIFVAGTNYSYLKAPMLPLQLLSHLPLICSPSDYPSRALMDNMLIENGINIKPAYELSSSDMILQYALNNYGVAFLPKSYTIPYIENGSLFELVLSIEMPTLPLYLVTESEINASKAALTLADTLSGVL